MTIRPATLADLPALLRMAAAFVEQTSYRGKLASNADAVVNLVHGLLQQGLVLVAADGDTPIGMLGAIVFVSPMTGEKTANELALWVEPGHRAFRTASALLNTFEAWAQEQGATVVQLSAPAGEQGARVGRLYGHRGYEPLETTYQRRVA